MSTCIAESQVFPGAGGAGRGVHADDCQPGFGGFQPLPPRAPRSQGTRTKFAEPRVARARALWRSPASRTERPGCGGGSRVRAVARLAASARRSRAPPAPCAPPPCFERGPAAGTRVCSGRRACALRHRPVALARVPTHLDVLADPCSSLRRCPPVQLLS